MLSFEETPHETADPSPSVVRAVTSTGEETVWLAQTDGPEVTADDADPRFGGVFVAPRERVLGIRLWRDVHEGVEAADQSPVSWGIYEIEKIVRMMLHQSPMALEMLASPASVERFASTCFQPRRIVESAITSDILQAYADEATGLLESAQASSSRSVALRGLRKALVGLALSKGAVVTRLDALVEWSDGEGCTVVVDGEEPSSIAARGRSIVEDFTSMASPVLPDAPTDYDGLDALVVERRMAVSQRQVAPKQGGES